MILRKYMLFIIFKRRISRLFEYLDTVTEDLDENFIKNAYKDKFCENVELSTIIENNPVELAYALAIIGIGDDDDTSITPAWVLKQYPKVEIILKQLCNTPCNKKCSYCEKHINIHTQLKNILIMQNLENMKENHYRKKLAKLQ